MSKGRDESIAGAPGLRLSQTFVPKPDVAARLRDALGLLEAIEQGELLAFAPQEPSDRRRHEAGLAILATLNRELERLLAEVRVFEDVATHSEIEAEARVIRGIWPES